MKLIVWLELDAGAAEVHMRIASPPTTDSCFYGVDTPAYESQHDFRGVTEGLAALIAELGARGIAVEMADAQEQGGDDADHDA